MNKQDDGKKEYSPPAWPEIRRHIIAGAGAGSMTSLVTCPLDVVKTRMQYLPITKDGTSSKPEIKPKNEQYSKFKQSNRPYRGTYISLRRIWEAEGFRGLYRGLGPTLLGYLPTFGLYFPAYHNYKYYLGRWSERAPTDPLVHLTAAIAAGATSSFITNPLWLIRTRLMTQSPYTPYFYYSAWHAFRSIWYHEGFFGLYKGLTPAALGLFHVAIQFPLYEKLKQLQRIESGNVNERLSSPQILLASTLSKVTATMVTYPHEVLRTRFQNQITHPPKYTSIPQAVRLIFKEEGLRGFYRGLGTTVMRVVPASAVTFISYEFILNHLQQP